jgi:hypothetical protein
MELMSRRVRQRVGLVVVVVLAASGLASAQATSTFNGRVLDQGEAVLPGVTVTAVNTSTGVARTTVTNSEGVYNMPGLEPGVYDVRTDLTGFASAVRQRVTLAVNTTLTLDFKLALTGVQETSRATPR